MTENRLDVIAEHVMNNARAGLDVALALQTTQRKLEKAENRIALLEKMMNATLEVMNTLQDRIEELQDLVEKGVIK